MEAATLEAPAPVQTEVPIPVVPQPTVAEILEQHLDHAQQKKIAVETLNKIPFLIAPDGKSAVSTDELKGEKHREIVETSLKTLLGERPNNASYLSAPEGIGERLGLSTRA